MGHKESKQKQADQACCDQPAGKPAPPPQQGQPPGVAKSSSAPAKPPEPPKLAAVKLPRANDGWRLPDRYEVKRSIGKGSYGSVCECYDRERKTLVAAKQLKGLFDDLVDCKRILRELAILTKLDSDCVVRVHDIVIPGDIPTFNELYIVLEICDSDMKKLVRTDVMLSALHINTLLYNLLVGLKYIHSAGVYHRDLKPANCLVNQNCAVKICDFGLARAIGGEGMDGRLSDEESEGENHGRPVVPSTQKRKRAMTQHVVTRWYRAPEVILLQHGYTEAIDIWSVGCIYAELLQMQDGSSTESIRFSDRGPVFPGSSCFPLSPERRKSGQSRPKSRGKNDQLEMIFSVLGTPTDEEAAALENEDARRYVRNFPAGRGEGLASRLPRVSPEAVDILGRMLRFSPKARLGVQQALEHPLLAAIRDPAAETTAGRVVSLEFEREELKEAQLRHYFGEEKRKFDRGQAQ